MTNPIGLYIHIPFCRQRCDFCAFYLELYRNSSAAKFLQGLRTEIELQAAYEGIRGRSFQSVYFGGGTPTALKADQLVEILSVIRQFFNLTHHCEVTVEAHPSTVTQSDLTALRMAGVTRISFGAESLQDDELVRIGRPGLAAETIVAVRSARTAGFTNINLDLMYGLPGQTLASYSETLAQCIELTPAHLSCYALTVEEGTRLAQEIRHKRCPAPDDSVQIAMDQIAQTMLADAGYLRYEISNYSKPGFSCRHNLLYWTHGEYLGLGPSAQSFVQGVRFGNVANLDAYQTTLARRLLPIHEQVSLTSAELLRDSVVFGLRLIEGIPTRNLQKHAVNYGQSKLLDDLQAQRLLEEDGDRCRLTSQGRLYADTIAEKLY